MLNLAVKNKKPRVRSPKPRPRRANFTSSLPLYSSRRLWKDQKEDERVLNASLKPMPATLAVSLPPLPSNRGRSPTLAGKLKVNRKIPSWDPSLSLSATPSMKSEAFSLDRKGQSLDLSGKLRPSILHNDILKATDNYEDNMCIQSPQQTKNLINGFNNIGNILQPAYERVVKARSQTYPFIIGLKTVDPSPFPSGDEELRVSWVCILEQ